jgi:hypothetical protein
LKVGYHETSEAWRMLAAQPGFGHFVVLYSSLRQALLADGAVDYIALGLNTLSQDL